MKSPAPGIACSSCTRTPSMSVSQHSTGLGLVMGPSWQQRPRRRDTVAPMRRRLVVIGGAAGGVSAARQALRVAARTGLDLEVVALERSDDVSYSQCGVPYWIAGDVESGDALVARTAEQHRANGIDLRLEAEATEVDLERHEVVVRQAGREERLG